MKIFREFGDEDVPRVSSYGGMLKLAGNIMHLILLVLCSTHLFNSPVGVSQSLQVRIKEFGVWWGIR